MGFRVGRSSGRRARRRVLRGPCAGVIAVVALASSVVVMAPGYPTAVAAQPPSRPNVVVVMTDDMTTAELAQLPHVQELLVRQGRTFEQYAVSVPVCCPSRVTMLRGQYAHNTGVLRNVGAAGGFVTAHDAGLEADMLGPLLHRAGYTTGLIGRYLNGYPRPLPLTWVPEGWDDWMVAVNNLAGVFDYTLNDNGVLVDRGSAPEDYLTDVQFDRARSFIEARGADEPFLLWLAPNAPHAPSIPAPRHEGSFAGATVPASPSRDETDLSDKPAYLRSIEPHGERRRAHLDAQEADRLEALQSVDEGVADLIETLAATGNLQDTYVVFSSDNGYHLGHHGMLAGKNAPYEEDVRVPFVVRGPGVPAGTASEDLAGNVDLLPTILGLAGVAAPEHVDGRDLSAQWHGAGVSDRRAFPIEHWQKDLSLVGTIDLDEASGVLELRPGSDASVPDFVGFRTARWKYVRYATDERELYDLRADPYELDNLAPRWPAATLGALDAYTTSLASCAGAACRAADQIPVPIPEPIEVDGVLDGIDPAPGDGVCGGDAGTCSVRAAVMEANARPGQDVIRMAGGEHRLTIVGAGEDASAAGDLDVEGDLLVEAGGAVVVGDGADRVLDVRSGAVTVLGGTIAGGVGAGGESGGGVAVRAGARLRLDGTEVRGNQADDGGGIAAAGPVALVQVAVADNVATGRGGGVAVTEGGALVVERSAIIDNAASEGGGVWVGAGTASVAGVTVDGNSATLGAGVAVAAPGTVDLADVTVVGDAGGALALSPGAAASVVNSIIDSAGADCAADAPASGGWNLASDDSCGLAGPSDLVAEPRLVARTGAGAVVVRAPTSESPAVDSGGSCRPLDQRGVPRPLDGGCDRGAVEQGGRAPFGTGAGRNHLGTGTALGWGWREHATLAVGGPCTSKERGDLLGATTDHNFSASSGGGGTFVSCVPGPSGAVRASADFDPAGQRFVVQLPLQAPVAPMVLEAQGLAMCASDDLVPGATPFAVAVTVTRVDGAGASTVVAAPRPIDASTDGGAWCGDPNDHVMQGASSTWRALTPLDARPGERFVVEVAATGPFDDHREQGLDEFALRVRTGARFTPCSAVTGDAHFDPTCPSITAVGGHTLVRNRARTSSTMPVAVVGPEHGGKVLQVDLWDPADDAVWFDLRDPAGHPASFTYEVACQDGTFPSERLQPCTGERGPFGGYGPLSRTRMTTDGTVAGCGRRPVDQVSGCGRFNDRLVRLRVPLPADIEAAWGGATTWTSTVRRANTGPSADAETWRVAVVDP